MIITRISRICRGHGLAVALGSMVLLGGPAAAQGVRTVDPDTVIDGDLATPQQPAAPAPVAPPAPAASDPFAPAQNAPVPSAPVSGAPASPGFGATGDASPAAPDTGELSTASTSGGPIPASAPAPANQAGTYSAEELLPAAEGVFGKGAQGLAQMIQDLLKEQGQPNGYIVGVEGGGALFVGLRYGSGTLYHKIEGQREVHWTGPSIGADVGASGGRTFILVYNLYDTNDLFHRYAAGEGQAYLLGGFNISELKRKDVMLIPVRLGVGLRLGLNVGYMKFSQKKELLPF